jgi:hypothetical protein
MRVPAAARPSWLLMVGAPPESGSASSGGLREALRAGAAAVQAAPGEERTETGNDGRGTALEER